jgi:hypothetical protein
MHINKTNGKRYVGITSQKIKNRWGQGSKYHSQFFGRAIKKYGWDGFEHNIISENLSKEDALEMEKILIKAYDLTNPQKGYNMTFGGEGGGMYNKHHSEKSKEKIRTARKGIEFSEEHKKHISEAKQGANHHLAKKVYQYTKQGKFIREWDYMSQASKELNINKANIAETCNGNRKSAGGYVWKYERA